MKLKSYLFFCAVFITAANSFAQHSLDMKAVVNTADKTIHVEQVVVYRNTSIDTLTELYFHDWNNSFKSTDSPLGRRFSEDFVRRFHFARDSDRGATVINGIQNQNGDSIFWSRPFMAPDIVTLQLDNPLPPNEEMSVALNYDLIIPSDRFTGYGYNNDGDFKLRYWYITPAIYKDGWQAYSNKNLDDQYIPLTDLKLQVHTPNNFYISTALDEIQESNENGTRVVMLSGEDRVGSKLYLTKKPEFEFIQTRKISVVSNIEDSGLNEYMKTLTIARIMEFLKQRLGEYPHKKLMVTQEEYKSNPVYGLNQLPEFIRPFPEGFQYDLKQLKIITNNYLENTLLINPRKDHWLHDAIHISLMMDYVEEYYPDMKILGSLSNFYGVRWTRASELEFNDQYPLLYLHMARQNMDQSLITPQDSLITFNKNIANAYKAGTGFTYVAEFAGKEMLEESIKEYFQKYTLKETDPEDFKEILMNNSSKDLEWFFEDYVGSNKKIDFRIKKVEEVGDSLQVTILNKRNNNMPVSLYGIREGRTVYQTWVENVNPEKTITIPKEGIERLALNYELIIPEVNARNNYKGVETILNKPIQFRLFQDVEDPRYSQVFFMPEFDYNLYDGAILGAKIYNKTFLKRNFNYNISPKFGFHSKTLIGSGSVYNTFQIENRDLYAINVGAGGSRYSFGYGLFYQTFTPFLSLDFRNKNLRSNERQSIRLSNVNVYRDTNDENPLVEPNYNVLSVKYNYSNQNLVNYLTSTTDFQVAKGFSKVSFSFDYRKLFQNNRQINLRFFAGTFLYNEKRETDYFSFALDRPTDYLFEYNYYGRSESSGLFSQQVIMAEGGFKSQLKPEFANQWLTTINGSTNIWKWIYAYGDVGLVKNKDVDAELLFDSGVRLSLITDYFEIFFPVYSSLGWEIGAENYDQRIRFIATLSLDTLTRLFSRRWY